MRRYTLCLWALALFATTLYACASAGRSMDAQNIGVAGAEQPPKVQVEALLQEIAANNPRLHLRGGLQPERLSVAPQYHTDPSDDRPLGPQKPSSTCDRAAHAICTSSGKICTIAHNNTHDAWFAQKCAASSGMCRGAQSICRTQHYTLATR